MTRFDAMKAVYCYHFPEVRDLLREVQDSLPDDLWLVTEHADSSALENVAKILKIPATKDGCVDLDEIHVPIIDRIVKAYKSVVPALGDFEFRYPTSGSSEGLFHVLTKARIDGVKSINVLLGEYEGYEAQAANLKMRVNKFDLDKTAPKNVRPGLWFISNPSARDGNIIPNETIEEICDAGHKVVLDLAYVGATRPYEFDVSHENVDSVVMSFSKPYGVFRFRIGGFAFSRDEIPSLYGNKWFKDVTRLFQALAIAERIGPKKLHKKYSVVQRKIIDGLNERHGLSLRASDSFLLAHLKPGDNKALTEEQLKMIAPYKRGNGYRFCLTPYFELEGRLELIKKAFSED